MPTTTRKYSRQHVNEVRSQLLDLRDAQEAHATLNLLRQDVYGSLCPRLAKPTLRKQEGATESHSSSPQAQGLDHICATSHASIHPDLDLVKQVRGALAQLDEDFKGGASVVDWRAASEASARNTSSASSTCSATYSRLRPPWLLRMTP